MYSLFDTNYILRTQSSHDLVTAPAYVSDMNASFDSVFSAHVVRAALTFYVEERCMAGPTKAEILVILLQVQTRILL